MDKDCRRSFQTNSDFFSEGRREDGAKATGDNSARSQFMLHQPRELLMCAIKCNGGRTAN
jgi:hypothetical protein